MVMRYAHVDGVHINAATDVLDMPVPDAAATPAVREQKLQSV